VWDIFIFLDFFRNMKIKISNMPEEINNLSVNPSKTPIYSLSDKTMQAGK
jgi:hypothetical protein